MNSQSLIKKLFKKKAVRDPAAKYSALEIQKQEMMALRMDTYAIFVTPKNGMNERYHVTRQPLESDFTARLLAGALKNTGAYANIVICRRNKAGYYCPLKIQAF